MKPIRVLLVDDQSDEGRASLQQASAVYRSRDVGYRSATEPVVKELRV